MEGSEPDITIIAILFAKTNGSKLNFSQADVGIKLKLSVSSIKIKYFYLGFSSHDSWPHDFIRPGKIVILKTNA